MRWSSDLCPDHLLVDKDCGHLVGLIDWTDTSLGDPALDIAFLAMWRGWDFTLATLTSYTPKIDSDFHGRLVFLARV